MTRRALLIALKVAIWKSRRPQWEIAHRAGLSASTLSYIVTGRRRASEGEKRRLARILGSPVEALFGQGPER